MEEEGLEEERDARAEGDGATSEVALQHLTDLAAIEERLEMPASLQTPLVHNLLLQRLQAVRDTE